MATGFNDATIEEVENAVQVCWKAFEIYRQRNLKERAEFLRTIALKLQSRSKEIIATAQQETSLDEGRLTGEFNRTVFQLNNYAMACEEGTWLDIRIDTADPGRTPPKPDLRKMLVPLGPVVVFGASNFPFAYSTAGGDTASALAAGCTVLIKAHPAHGATSELAAEAVQEAARKCGLPEGVFIHLHGTSFEVGQALVQHPLVKAVGFTGSFEGGKALFDLANKRKIPIPVFAEMGSVNPVFLMPGKLRADAEGIASMYAVSITMSAGQFCTNPGLMIGIESAELDVFLQLLGAKIKTVKPAKMLHEGIAKNFQTKRKKALAAAGVELAAETEFDYSAEESIPTLAKVEAQHFLKNSLLQQEVFGPYSLLVVCKDKNELLSVAEQLEGQLTVSMMATDEDIRQSQDLVAVLQDRCGRFVLNGVPTGVEVALSMHHGGPYPATTDSRFTSVGADAIKRFARPLCFQNWSDDLLPVELKNENKLTIWRTVNNGLTQESIK